VGEDVDVSVGCGVSVGVAEGEGEVEGEITDPAVGGAETASVSPELITEVLWTGKLQAIPRTIQITPITINHIGGEVWFLMRFISTFSSIPA
jgi:hypothetical protein